MKYFGNYFFNDFQALSHHRSFSYPFWDARDFWPGDDVGRALDRVPLWMWGPRGSS